MRNISRFMPAISSGSFLLMLFTSFQGPQKQSSPFLNQTLPGLEVIPFAAEFLGHDLHSSPVFSPGAQEVFWSPLGTDEPQILTSRLTESGWSSPKQLIFPSGPDNSGDPCLSPDGTRLFFLSQASAADNYRETIWFSDREAGSWGKPHPIGPTVDDLETHWQFSVATSGNLYFHSRQLSGGGIVVSHFQDGAYGKPVPLSKSVNTNHGEGSPCVAPDESYLLFTRIDRESTRKSDIFISIRRTDGSWSDARGIDELNSDGRHDLCPRLSPDGAYLFLLRSTDKGYSPYWVSTRILDKYRRE